MKIDHGVVRRPAFVFLPYPPFSIRTMGTTLTSPFPRKGEEAGPKADA
jgi:hypothetical protein